MKDYYLKKTNKFCFIVILVVLVAALTSCRGGSWQSRVYTSWGAEFTGLSGFFQIVFGWPVAILSYPFAFLMSTIGGWMGNSYALGIIFTTIIVRTCAWPIYSKQNSSTIKMQLIQPEMAKIQRKYQGRKDPESQRRMQAETMALYKKYKMNPLGCVATMFIQFPIFMAMYECVQRINLIGEKTLDGGATILSTPSKFALSHTKIFGYFELDTSFFSADLIRDKIFAVILAGLFAGVTILSQKLASRTPSYVKGRPNQPNQSQTAKQMKIMSYVMTGMFVFMSLSSTSLALYWLVGGVYQIGQSAIGRKQNERNYYKMKEKTI